MHARGGTQQHMIAAATGLCLAPDIFFEIKKSEAGALSMYA
jgi:hypothetical protein